MRPFRILAIAVALALALAGCDVKNHADAKFGDQHFKTALALVELHKVRSGTYPETLRDIPFAGDWDAIALSSVEYRRLGAGYELNLMRGWIGKPDIAYPPEFWRGLGLLKSNMRPGT